MCRVPRKRRNDAQQGVARRSRAEYYATEFAEIGNAVFGDDAGGYIGTLQRGRGSAVWISPCPKGPLITLVTTAIDGGLRALVSKSIRLVVSRKCDFDPTRQNLRQQYPWPLTLSCGPP